MQESHRLLEFDTRDDWVAYALENMRNIDTNRSEDEGVEVHLVSSRGVIGMWKENQGYGFIREYRTPQRLQRDRAGTALEQVA